MRSLLVIKSPGRKNDRSSASFDGKRLPPDSRLASIGYQVHVAVDETQAAKAIPPAEAAILHLPLPDVQIWTRRLSPLHRIPLLWWCDRDTAPLSPAGCESGSALDGLLSDGMENEEIHWMLHIASGISCERRQWAQQREQLLARLEERKWVDKAKGILSEIKGIGEAEAYEYLRKTAMNERRRLVDVAISIVKVYQLLQEQKQGGRSK